MLENGGQGAASRMASDLRVIIEAGSGPLHFVPVFAKRFTAFERHRGGEFLLLSSHPRGHLTQHRSLFYGGYPPPFSKRFACRVHRAIRIFGSASRHLTYDFFVRWIDYGNRFAMFHAGDHLYQKLKQAFNLKTRERYTKADLYLSVFFDKFFRHGLNGFNGRAQ